MHPSDQEREDFAVKALQVYDEQLRCDMERDHSGRLLGLEPDTGDFVLGDTFGQVSQAFRIRFGTLPAYYLQIGDGQALRTQGAIHGRAS
jgi:hypothetical protein